MTKKDIISLLIFICVIGFGVYQYQHREYRQKKSKILLDTVVEISAKSQSKNVGAIIDSTFALISRYEDQLSEFKVGSYIWNVNHSDATEFPMNPDVYAMLVVADSLYKVTDGRYDLTIGAVSELWDWERSRLPNPDSLKVALKTVGFDKLKFDKSKLYRPIGTKINLGSISKGYIIEKAVNYMKANGVYAGYIDCRSSIVVFDRKNRPLTIGIQHPRKPNDVIAALNLRNSAIGTSGDYQQFFELNGKRYHHILDPKTGYPVENVYSVTVVNPSVFHADALSTALFVMAPEKAIDYIKTIPNSDAIIYYQTPEGIVSLKSMGMKKYLKEEHATTD